MSDNCQGGLHFNPSDLCQALAIHTRKITDSCRDKDCIEDLRVYLTQGSQSILDTAATAVIEYPISPIARKQVVFCLGKVTGNPSIREGEIDKYKWVAARELKDHLYPDAAKACHKLLRQLAAQ
jgi:hypothetical protein